MTPEEIKKLIEQGINNCTAFIEGDDGRHFKAVVISPDFLHKSRIEQQQLVYTALGDTINNGAIHAISVKTYTPEAWVLANNQ